MYGTVGMPGSIFHVTAGRPGSTIILHVEGRVCVGRPGSVFHVTICTVGRPGSIFHVTV